MNVFNPKIDPEHVDEFGRRIKKPKVVSPDGSVDPAEAVNIVEPSKFRPKTEEVEPQANTPPETTESPATPDSSTATEEEQPPDMPAMTTPDYTPIEYTPSSQKSPSTNKKSGGGCLSFFLGCIGISVLLVIIASVLVFFFPQVWVPTAVKLVYPEDRYPCMYQKPEERDAAISSPVDTTPWANLSSTGDMSLHISVPFENNTEDEDTVNIWMFEDGSTIAITDLVSSPLTEEDVQGLEEVNLTEQELLASAYEYTVDDFLANATFNDYLTNIPFLILRYITTASCDGDTPYYKYQENGLIVYQHTEGDTLALTISYTDSDSGDFYTGDVLISSDTLTQEEIDAMVHSIAILPGNTETTGM